MLYFMRSMQNFSMRLLAVIFWIERNIKKIVSRKHGLAGIFICLIVVGFFSTIPLSVHATTECDALTEATKKYNALSDADQEKPENKGAWDAASAACAKSKAAAGGEEKAKAETNPEKPATTPQNTFDKFILILADLALTVAVVLSKLIVAIIDILMPIMLYNQFATSPVVTNGWAIVRDTVNMFFVIVLIAIAFGTIFGNERFKWQSQIVRLMIFAVVINFSKTLCGLMIDFGQVVMLTFANAIREIAAGNFVQLFGMGDIYSLSPQSSVFTSAASDSASSGVQAFDWFAASLASVFMAAMVLGTMAMLLTILVYRVVMLWIMIVISPLAWFVGGAKGIITSGAYAEWWKEFIALIAVGPVLTFFLWLTLVVAGAGNISDDAHITSGSTDAALNMTAGGFVTKAFELNRLISFVIAIAMLYAGFKAAKGLGLKGFIGSAIEGGAFNNQAVNAVKGTAALGAKMGAGGLRLGGRAAVGTVKGIGNVTGASDAISRKKESMMRGVAAGAGTGYLGRQISRAATKSADASAAGRAAKITEAGEKFKGDSRESKMDQLNRFAASPAGTPGGKKEAQALLMDAMGDEKSMKELRASGNLEKLWAEHGGSIQKDMKGDKGMQSKVEAFKKQHADITGSANQIKTLADVTGLSSFALADDKDGKLKAQMAKVQTTIKKDGGGFYNALEAMQEGKVGNTEQQDAITKGRSAIFEGMSSTELSRQSMETLAPHLSATLLENNPDVARRVARDPSVMNKMSGSLFEAAMGSDEASSAFAGALSQTGALNAAIAAIKKNPHSDENKQLRSRVEGILAKAKSQANATPEVRHAEEMFGAHMGAIDARTPKSTAQESTELASKLAELEATAKNIRDTNVVLGTDPKDIDLELVNVNAQIDEIKTKQEEIRKFTESSAAEKLAPAGSQDDFETFKPEVIAARQQAADQKVIDDAAEAAAQAVAQAAAAQAAADAQAAEREAIAARKADFAANNPDLDKINTE